MKKTILYDTDLLGDDLLALFAMVKEPDVELLGITAYGRRISSLERCQITCAFLEEIGASGLKLVPGASHPIVQEPRVGCRYCDDVLCKLGESWAGKKCSSNSIDTSVSAAEFIVGKAKERPSQLSLLCTGPLTNIALAVSICPELPSLVKEVVIMGGTWRECGNTSAVSESNIFNDVEAAKIVFDCFPAITIVPLDVTLKVLARMEELPKNLPESIYGIISSCCDSHKNRGEESVMPLHDVLAYFVLMQSDLCVQKKCSVKIETNSCPSRGMMIFDFKEGSHSLCVDVNASDVENKFLKILAGDL